MDKLKNFKLFIKENSEDENLYNFPNDIEKGDVENLENIPSELWTDEMADHYNKFESNTEDLDNIEDDGDNDSDSENDKVMKHKVEDSDITESYSELEDYNVKNVFEEEENEEE